MLSPSRRSSDSVLSLVIAAVCAEVRLLLALYSLKECAVMRAPVTNGITCASFEGGVAAVIRLVVSPWVHQLRPVRLSRAAPTIHCPTGLPLPASLHGKAGGGEGRAAYPAW